MTAQLSLERVGRITASRLPKILGVSPFGDEETVLREMIREYCGAPQEFAGNIATRYGEEHEPDAIEAYEWATGATVHKTGLAQDTIVHPDIDYLAATLDGLVGDNGVVEAKAPYRARYSRFEQRPDIEIQMRLQLECAQRETADLAIWYPDGLVQPIPRVTHDPKWLPGIRTRCEDFMARFLEIVADFEKSAPYLAPLTDVRTDDEWTTAAHIYRECRFIREQDERLENEARDELYALAGEAKQTRGGGVLVSRVNPSSTVSYAAALKHYAPGADLAPFTKEASGEARYAIRLSK
jgi:hypothetical protein